MKSRILFSYAMLFASMAFAQAPQPSTASQILLNIKKLHVLGSVLYIAAHPDDENTRLIAWMANDKLYRTGYLSLTRGDGGQNLIGDEQGVELGLIRTQELLSARRIDGGEQFFSRAYDFGFSKGPEETLKKWDREKILSDVVWIIRKFQPDVIITRFPTTGEGGHGHHTASAILANEAFTAAADPNRFPDQLKFVKPWQAKRILWNTFSFGNINTTDASQFHINVGGYNSILGKSYGEIAAQSRSQHKSQGFGSAPSRGDAYEYFKTTGGVPPQKELTDDVNITWERIGAPGKFVEIKIAEIENNFNADAPEKSVPALVDLYKMISKLDSNNIWVVKKQKEVQQIIMQCNGLYLDAYTNQPFAVQTSNVDINFSVNNRLGMASKLVSLQVDGVKIDVNDTLSKNKNYSFSKSIPIPLSKEITQPYWLKEKMEENCYTVSDQQLIGVPDVQPAYVAKFFMNIDGEDFVFEKPVQYKYTDPVKGEIYEPLCVAPAASITASPHLLIFKGTENKGQLLQTQLHANTKLDGNITAGLAGIDYSGVQTDNLNLTKGQTQVYHFKVNDTGKSNSIDILSPYANKKTASDTIGYYLALRSIHYDHIPAIHFFYPDFVKALHIDLKTAGKKIGYIPGAGDKVAPVLERMGYTVIILDKETLATTDLKKLDAIITGVRAYNTNDWMNEYYDKLMDYVKEGGNFIVQYNTNNNLGVANSKMGPYSFEITRNRITDEDAAVTFLNPSHKIFNFPNKITQKDFEGWVQERSIYHAANWDNNLQPLLSMADPGEAANDGSLITGQYGKGYFTYTGLVFYRELPAAVPGALRLIANLIALNQDTINP